MEAERYRDLGHRRFTEPDRANRIAIWEEAELLNQTFRSREECQEARDAGDLARARRLKRSHAKWCTLRQQVRTAMNAVDWSHFSFSLRDPLHLSILYDAADQERVEEFREPFLRRLFLVLGARTSGCFRVAFSPTRLPSSEGEPIVIAMDSYDYRPRMR